MKKLYMILFVSSFALSGCTSGYRVYVNGYSETDAPIKHQSKIYVSDDDPNSPNPILGKQVKTKIEALLERNDYTPTSELDQSQYRISYQVGMDSHNVSGYEPIHHHSYIGFHSGYWSGYDFGYTTYIPYYDTYYDQWFNMKVYARDGETDEEKVVWVGEAIINSGSGDIRQVIDYLLVGCFEYFGVDTSRQRSIVIAADNPDILQIESMR